MISGVVIETEEGCTQGGPLSPLLCNIMLTELDRPWKRKFLGVTFYQWYGKIGIRVHDKSVNRFKNKVRKITSRNNVRDMEYTMIRLRQVITGWLNYFGIADMSRTSKELDECTRRRIRMCFWKQWKKIKLSMII